MTDNRNIHISKFGIFNDTSITTINNTVDTLTSGSNLILNNSLLIPLTENNTTINNNNNNTLIALKDRIDGKFKSLLVYNNDLYIHPYDIENSSLTDISNNKKLLLRQDDLENEINLISDNIEFSNIHINRNNGYINFYDSNTNLNSQTVDFGFRVNTGTLQYKKNIASDWVNFGSGGEGGGGIDNVIDDTTPQLGGDLDTNNNNIILSSGSNIILANDNSNIYMVDNSSNIIVEMNNNNTSPNHIIITKTNISSTIIPEITVSGSTNVDLRIKTQGNGDLYLDTNGVSDGGDIIINTSNIDINDMSNLNIASGRVNLIDANLNLIGNSHITSSLQFIKNTDLSTNILIPTNITCNSDTLIFNIIGNDGRFYANLSNGEQGQNTNIIYDTSGSNNIVEVRFNNNGNVGIGTGMAKKLIFTTSGQATSIIYLQFLDDNSRNRWQILNTGCDISN